MLRLRKSRESERSCVGPTEESFAIARLVSSDAKEDSSEPGSEAETLPPSDSPS